MFASYLWQIAIMIAAAYISASMAPKQQAAKPVAFQDINFPQFEEGTAQAVIFGDCWTGDWMVLAVGNYRVETISAESSGKK